MRHIDISVLEIGDQHQVVIDDHVGDEVVLGDAHEAEGLDAIHKPGQRQQETEIGQEDITIILRREQSRARAEVISGFALQY